jgi:hypothetical protein
MDKLKIECPESRLVRNDNSPAMSLSLLFPVKTWKKSRLHHVAYAPENPFMEEARRVLNFSLDVLT